MTHDEIKKRTDELVHEMEAKFSDWYFLISAEQAELEKLCAGRTEYQKWAISIFDIPSFKSLNDSKTTETPPSQERS